MTLILKLDLDMVKMYLHTENEVSVWSGSKVIAWTDRGDRQTDRHDWKHYLPTYMGGKNVVSFWKTWLESKTLLQSKNK